MANLPAELACARNEWKIFQDYTQDAEPIGRKSGRNGIGQGQG